MTNKNLEFEEERNIEVWKRVAGGKSAFGKIEFDSEESEYIFYPDGLPCHLNSDILKEISTFLDKLNKEHKEGK